MSKSQKPKIQEATTSVPFEVNAFDITNPSTGVVGFDPPPLADGQKWVYTIIDAGVLIGGVFQLRKSATGVTQGGVFITQYQWIAGTGSPINPYVNGDGRIVMGIIPAGTFAVRVYHRTGVPDGSGGFFNYKDYYSVIKDGFTF